MSFLQHLTSSSLTAYDTQVEITHLQLTMFFSQARSMDKVDEDSQAFLDSLQDITDSNSRSAFSSSQVKCLFIILFVSTRF